VLAQDNGRGATISHGSKEVRERSNLEAAITTAEEEEKSVKRSQQNPQSPLPGKAESAQKNTNKARKKSHEPNFERMMG
jgi:hypothetical protein